MTFTPNRATQTISCTRTTWKQRASSHRRHHQPPHRHPPHHRRPRRRHHQVRPNRAAIRLHSHITNSSCHRASSRHNRAAPNNSHRQPTRRHRQRPPNLVYQSPSPSGNRSILPSHDRLINQSKCTALYKYIFITKRININIP